MTGKITAVITIFILGVIIAVLRGALSPESKWFNAIHTIIFITAIDWAIWNLL